MRSKTLHTLLVALLALVLAAACLSGAVLAAAGDGKTPATAQTVTGSDWKPDGDKWTCVVSGTKLMDSWVTQDGNIFYLDGSGYMATGFQQFGGKAYYFDSAGHLNSGQSLSTFPKWLPLGTVWYYGNADGSLASGIAQIDGKYYGFEYDGSLCGAGWHTVNGVLFFTDSSGIVQTKGYQKWDGKWYLMTTSGAVRDTSITGDYLAILDVTDPAFGANGSDSSSDSAAFEAAMLAAIEMDNPSGKTILIKVPAGTYRLDTGFAIYSNITLQLDSGATMLRTNIANGMVFGGHRKDDGTYCYSDSSCTHGGYTQISNVKITGGVWDGGVYAESSSAYAGNMMQFAHGSNVTIENTTLKNDSSVHMLMLDAMKDVTVRNVVFQNAYLFTGIDTSYYGSTASRSTFTAKDWYDVAFDKEAIHIDLANKEGSTSYPLDNTVCQNITVTGCTFDHVLAGVGNHHALGSLYSTNITVTGCTFKSVKGSVINGYHLTGFKVTDNTVSGAGYFVNADGGGLTLSGNTVTDAEQILWARDSAVSIEKDSYATVASSALKIGDPALRLQESSTLTMKNVTLTGGPSGGVILVGSTGNITGLTLTKAGGDAAVTFSTGSTGSLKDSTISGTAQDGVHAFSVDNLTVSGVTAKDFAEYGVKVHESTKVYVDNNVVTGSLGGTDIYFVNVTTGSITGNNVTATGGDYVWTHQCSGLTISNNTGAGTVPAKVTNGWAQDGGKWYYYKDSAMVKGWQGIGGVWYYFDPTSGAMTTGWFGEGGKWYYFKGDGAMATGWLGGGSNWYYFNTSTGAMASGWQGVDGKWYYFDPSSGLMTVGWKQIGGTWYYFTSSGAMATGWLGSGSTWYYFDTGSGAMATGWKGIGGKWYHFSASGAMTTGWLGEGGKWYYFKGDGAMATGWLGSGSSWYYFNTSTGAMASGWQGIGGTWYYFDPSSGLMAAGWKLIDGDWYYFTSSGVMTTGWLGAGGKWYYFNPSGVMITGWRLIDGGWYYFDANGVMVTGQQTIDGAEYTFDADGRML